MKILPWLAASAVDDPEMPAKKTDSSTLICASAPGKLPTIVRERSTRRSVMPPTFIRLAVSRKNGTASRMNELYALNVVLNTTIGESRGSMNSTGRQASPSANATGTRSTNSTKNVPNRSHAATVGVSAAPVIGPLRLRLPPQRCPQRRPAVPRRRHVRGGGPAAHDAQVREETFPEEQHPRESGERPRHEDVRHRHFRQLGVLVPAELHELDAVPDEYQREHEDEHVGNDAEERVRPRLEFGPHVTFEMRGVAHADHGAEHDHPDEQEPRHLLGPDPGRNEVGVARDDLQRHRHDQHSNAGGQQPVEQAVVAVDEFAHDRSPGALATKKDRRTPPRWPPGPAR